MANRMELVKSMLSITDKIQMENHILTKQNQLILDKLHDEAQEEVKSIFDEEEQAWLDNYIKDHNLDHVLELLDID